jgi:hypothetical protein
MSFGMQLTPTLKTLAAQDWPSTKVAMGTMLPNELLGSLRLENFNK